MEFDLIKKMELAELIRQDILSKWNSEEESLDDFIENYESEDIIDYMNATGLNLIWVYKKHPYNENDFIIQIKVLESKGE